MEWQQLEYFRAVARLEHFTRAAEQLAVSQPALSRSIARLEEELGVPLFEREGRSVRLTRYGRLFLQRVERAMREIAEARREIEELQDPGRGEVRLGFLHTFGIHLVPELIGEFHRIYPNVTFYLAQHAAGRIFRQLEAGEIDLCLLSPPVRRPGIGWVDLKTEELYVIVRPDHPLAGRGRVDLRELAGEPFISLKRGYGMRTITEELCARAGFSPHIAFEGEEVATVAGLVAAGLGVALVPDFPGLDAVRVHKLPVADPPCRRVIGMAWVEGRFLSPAAARFREFVIGRGRSAGHPGTPF